MGVRILRILDRVINHTVSTLTSPTTLPIAVLQPKITTLVSEALPAEQCNIVAEEQCNVMQERECNTE